MALFLHACHHLAGMARMHAVIAGRCSEQHRWIAHVLAHVLVRRISLQEVPVVCVGIAVFSHPRRTGQQLVIALHVQQRHLADHSTEQLRIHHGHVAHQQATIAAALDAQVLGRGDIARNQVFGHRREVFIGFVAVGFQCRLMPTRSIFAAATDVGDHIHPALAKPGPTHACGIIRRQRHFEAAIPIQQRRIFSVAHPIFLRHHEIGHAGAVFTGSELLADFMLAGIEEARQLLQFFRRFADRSQQQRGRGQIVGDGHEIVVGFIGIHGADADRAESRRSGQRRAGPAVLSGRQHIQAVFDVFQHVEDDVVLGHRTAGQRGVLRRLEQYIEISGARQKRIETDRQQATGLVVPSADCPRLAQLHAQPFTERAFLGAVRQIELEQCAVLAAQVQLVGVEGQAAVNEVTLEARRVVPVGADRNVGFLAFIHGPGRGHRRAALPFLGDARIAGAGHGSGSEVGTDIDSIGVDPADLTLGLGPRETAGDEGLVGDVELAGHIGIGTATRQRNQAAVVSRAQTIGAAPDPIDAFGLAQRIDIEQHFPAWRFLAVLGQSRAAPDALWIVFVAPEVVVETTHLADVGNTGVGIKNFQQAAAQGGETRIAGQLPFGDGIAGTHPIQGLGVFYSLQPKIWIFIHVLGSGRSHKNGGQHQDGKAHAFDS